MSEACFVCGKEEDDLEEITTRAGHSAKLCKECLAKHRFEEEMRENKDVWDATRALTTSINVMGRERAQANVMLDALVREHRTLQADFWRLIHLVAKKYAELPDRYFDQRNEDAREFAKKVAAIDQGIRRI